MTDKEHVQPCCKPGWFDRIWTLNEADGPCPSAPDAAAPRSPVPPGPEAGLPDGRKSSEA